MIIYSIRKISPLKVHISKLIFKELEHEEKVTKKYTKDIKKEKTIKYKEKSNTKLIKNKKLKNPPKKSQNIRIKTESSENLKDTKNNKLVNSHKKELKNKKKSNLNKRSKLNKNLNTNELEDVDNDFFNNDYNKKSNSILIVSKAQKKKNKEEKNRTGDLDMYELNNLEYDEACEMDNRGFCKTYWSVLMREHLILFTFCTCYDYNLFYIKIERFFILICTQMTINGLFFIHESMHRKYIQGEDLTFVEKLPQLLFTLIVAHVIEVILCYLSMTDEHIYEIKSLSKEEKKSKKLLNIMDRMKRRLICFFVVTFVLFLFYWYFISAFCAVYQNTQIIFLRDTGISILTSFTDPFVIYGITTILRLISLSVCCKKKLGCMYKLSEIIPIF